MKTQPDKKPQPQPQAKELERIAKVVEAIAGAGWYDTRKVVTAALVIVGHNDLAKLVLEAKP